MGWGCYSGWATADSNPDSWEGMYIVYHDPAGVSEKQVQAVRYTSGVLKINHAGGPIGIYNRHVVSGCCGSVSYKMVYTDGPLFGDPNTDYYRKLVNDAFNLENPANLIERYRATLGCILGQAGKKGNIVEHFLGSVPGYGTFLGEDSTESASYFIGHVACSFAFPEGATPRDIIACLYSGDDLGALLNSLGLLGPFKGALSDSDIFAAFMERNAGKTDVARDFFTQLDRWGLQNCWTDSEKLNFLHWTLKAEDITFLDDLLNDGDISLDRAIQYVESDKGLKGGYLYYETLDFNSFTGNLHQFNQNKLITVIGPYFSGQPTSYEAVGSRLGANYFYVDNNLAPDVVNERNEQFIKLAIRDGNDFICTANPATATPGSGFWTEVNIAQGKGYTVVQQWSETIDGVTYNYWRMAKV